MKIDPASTPKGTQHQARRHVAHIGRRVLITLLAATALSVAVAAAPAGAIVVNQPGPPAVGTGGSGAGGGGSVFTCSGPNSNPGGPQGGYISPFPLCTYDQWNKQSATISSNQAALCPTGYDVWHFYGMSNNPSVVTSANASHIAIHNSCNPNITPQSTVLSPTPTDAVFGGGGSAPLVNPDGQEFTYQSGPNHSNWGAGVFTSYNGNYTNTGWTWHAQGDCVNLQSNNTAAVQGIFAGLATDPGSVGPAATQWAKNFTNSSLNTNPGYLWWLWNSGFSYAVADEEMNVAPGTQVPYDAAGNPTTATWATLAAAYGVNTPSCSSGYQYTPAATPTNPQPAYPIYGTCIIPTQEAAIPWKDSAGNINPAYVAAGGNRYVPVGGDSYNTSLPWEGAAHAAWRNAIAGEVTDRFTGQADNTPWVGSHYTGVASAAHANGWADVLGAVSDAQTGAFCADGSAPVGTQPGGGSGCVAGDPTCCVNCIPQKVPPPSADQPINISVPTLVAGGLLRKQTITVTPGQFVCTNCTPTAGSLPGTEISVTYQVQISGTGGYKNFELYPTGGGAPIQVVNGIATFPAVKNTCSPVVGNNGTTYDLPGPGQCAAVNSPQTYTVGFLSATASGQQVTATIISAVGTYAVYNSAACTPQNVTVNGKVVSLCTHTYDTKPFALTIGAPQSAPVAGATAVPGS